MIQIFGHPFSSYTWKALIALWEKDVPFEFRILGPDHPDNVLCWEAAAATGQQVSLRRS